MIGDNVDHLPLTSCVIADDVDAIDIHVVVAQTSIGVIVLSEHSNN